MIRLGTSADLAAASGVYRAAGFIDCGVAETNFGTAPRLVLVLS
jgi:hypothetical protein